MGASLPSLKPLEFPGGRIPDESRRILLPSGSFTEAQEGTDRINVTLLKAADDAKVKRND